MGRNPPGRSPLLPALLLVGLILVGVVLFIAAGQGGQSTLPRANAAEVHDRVVERIKRTDLQGLAEELSPRLFDEATRQQARTAGAKMERESGRVVAVQVLEPLTVLNTGPTAGRWADSIVQVNRATASGAYLFRYIQGDDSRWYLFAAQRVQP